jgi:hypothetical protein
MTYRNILVIVDRLSKRKRIIPHNDITAEAVVGIFIYEIYKNYSLPSSIISDRGI